MSNVSVDIILIYNLNSLYFYNYRTLVTIIFLRIGSPASHLKPPTEQVVLA